MNQPSFGEELRRLRGQRGISLKKFAQLVHYDAGYLSKIENRLKPPTGALATACDEVLDTGGLLAQLAAEYAQGRQRRLHQHTLSGAAEVEKAKRRELVSRAVAIAFGGLLDEPVKGILAVADETRVPTRVQSGDVRHLQSAVATLESWDSHVGGCAVRHHAVAALRWATALLESSCTPAVRLQLAATTAQLADLASWATFDAGYREPARQVFLVGLQAAHESDDAGVRAHIAACLARQEIQAGDWEAGLDLVQLALTAGEALPSNALADLHAVKALAYARKQDTTACFRHINAAKDRYCPDSLPSDPSWLSYFTPAKFSGDLANAMYDLLLHKTDVSDARAHRLALINHYSKSFRQYPGDRVRGKGITATRLATLLHEEGERHMAYQITEEAITLANQVRSAQLADGLRILLRSLSATESADGYPLDLRRRVVEALTNMA